MKDKHLHIAFAFDRWAFRSAYVAIQTSAKSLAADSLITFHFFVKGLEGKHLKRLEVICRSLPMIANYHIYPVDDKEFSNCRSLYGNFMTYVRLLIPDLVGSDRIIYLDSDTLTNGDLTRLWKTNLGDYTIGSVSLATIQWSNDKTFLLQQGLSLEDPYFNAGILLIDCEKWRNKGIGHRLMEWARLYGPALPSVDQTLLNLFFHKGFHRLDPEWNQHIYPLSRPQKQQRGSFISLELQNHGIFGPLDFLCPPAFIVARWHASNVTTPELKESNGLWLLFAHYEPDVHLFEC
jgi:lipopolysaccharide biosynthesis glycosyltransferase